MQKTTLKTLLFVQISTLQTLIFVHIRQSIKQLVADGRFHYMETGSLITLRQNVEKILIPSEEKSINMYPMDFEEFLWAKGDDITIELIRENFLRKKPWAMPFIEP